MIILDSIWRYICVIIFISFFSSCEQKGVQKFVSPTKSYVKVQILEKLRDTVKVSAISSLLLPNRSSSTGTQDIYSKGSYYFEFEIDRPTRSYFSFGNIKKEFFVFPNDTTLVSLREIEDRNSQERLFDFSFTGIGSEINSYFIHKEEELGYLNASFPIFKLIQSDSRYVELKKQTDSLINTELQYFEFFCKQNKLPDWFEASEKENIQYTGHTNNTARASYNNAFSVFKDTINESYYDYVDEQMLNNPSAIFSSGYYGFLRSYFCRNLNLRDPKYNQHSDLERNQILVDSCFNGADRMLSGKPKEYFKKFTFSRLIEYYSDTLTVDSLAKVYDISEYQALLSVMGSRTDKKRVSKMDLIKGDTLPLLLLVNEADEPINFKSYNNQVVYINIWATWCGPCIKNFPNLNKLITQYEKDDRIRFVNICMRSERDAWRKSVATHDLKGTNLYASENWSDKLGSIFSLNGIPHYALIDKDLVLYKNFAERAPLAQEDIDELLNSQF